MAPHIRSHGAPCSCFPKEVSLLLSYVQSVGDARITQLDWLQKFCLHNCWVFAAPRRQTARRHIVRRDRATPRDAESLLDATSCRGTARHHVVRKDRATLRRADGSRDVTWCRGTAQRYGVQTDHVTSRGAEGPRDAIRCSNTNDLEWP